MPSKWLFLSFLSITSMLWAGSISGVVRQGGAPVANVAIQARDIEGGCVVARTVTNPQGFYAMAVIPEASFFLEYALPGGRTRFFGDDSRRNFQQAQVIFVSAAGTNVNVDLEGGASLGGTFTLVGENLSQAEVFLVDPFTLEPISSNRNILTEAGTFFQSGLQPGEYLVAAYLPTGTGDRRAAYYYPGTRNPNLATRFDVENREARTDLEFIVDVSDWATLVLQPDFSTTNQSNFAGSGAQLELVDANGLRRTISLTPEGATFLKLPPETFRARLLFENGFLSTDLGEIALRPGASLIRPITLNEGRVLSGTFQIGTAALNQAVVLEVLNADDYSSVALIKQERAGSFRIAGMQPGQYRLRPSNNAPEQTRARSVLAFPGATGPFETLPEVFDLSQQTTIEGIFIQATLGNAIIGSPRQQTLPLPAINARVNAYLDEADSPLQAIFNFDLEAFTLPGLSDGTYRLSVGLDQSTNLRPPMQQNRFANVLNSQCINLKPTRSEPLTLAGGEVRVDVHFQADHGHTVELNVRSADGTRVQNGLIYLIQNARLVGQSRVVGGHVTFGGLSAGNYELVFYRSSQFDDGGPPTPDSLANPLLRSDLIRRELQVGNVAHQVLPDWVLDRDAFGEPEPEGAVNFSGARQIVYPWVSNNPQFETLIHAQNLAETPITVTFTAIRGDGTFERATRDIPAGGFVGALASELFPELGQGEGYTVILDAPVVNVRGQFTTYNRETPSGSEKSPSLGLAALVPAPREATTPIVSPTLLFNWLPVVDPWQSAPVLVNLSDAPTNVDLIFYNQAGNLLASQTLEDLQPFQPFVALTDDLLSTTENVVMIARSTGFASLTGATFLFNDAGEPAISSALAIDPNAIEESQRAQIFPWVSRQTGGFNSSVILNNAADRNVVFQLRAFLDQGQSLSSSLALPPRGFINLPVQMAFPEMGEGSGFLLNVSADSQRFSSQLLTSNQAIGQSPSLNFPLTINDNIPDFFLSGRTLYFGQAPISQGFQAAIVLVNLGAEPQNLRLLIRDRNGMPVPGASEMIMDLPPGTSSPFMIRDLIGEFEDDVSFMAQMPFFPITGNLFIFNDEGEPAITSAIAVPDTLFPPPSEPEENP